MSTASGWDDDEPEILPDTTSDERAAGWGDPDDSNDDRLIAERPPHWE